MFIMDKGEVMVILREHLVSSDKGAYLHFIDGSNLLINNMPRFMNMHMQILSEYAINLKQIKEMICVPYSSIIYITLTNSENLKIVAEQYAPINDNFHDEIIEKRLND